jgi:16S rRNA processing protein RimM
VELFNTESQILARCGEVFVGKSEENNRSIQILEASKTPKAWLVYFSGIDSIDAAESLRGQKLWIEARSLPPLPGGEYYHFQLVGAQVINHLEETVGTVLAVESGPSCDTLVIDSKDGEITVPIIDDAIDELNIAAKLIKLKSLEGLLGDAD